MNKIVLLILQIVIVFSLSAQTVRFVSPTGAGLKDGSDWDNSYGNAEVQAAIDASGTNYQYWFKTGTYYPTKLVGGVSDRYRAFQLKNGVALYGGFSGSESQLTQRNWISNPTIFSGDIGVIDDNSDNCLHVVYHPLSGLNSSAVLDGFTITKGHANGSIDDEKRGAGMLSVGYTIANGSSQAVRNCVFTNNLADNGAAVYNSRYCHPTFTDCSFTYNTANVNGGAVYNTRNNPSFNSCIFKGNTALATGSSFGGGAMYNNTSAVTEGPSLTDCEFNENTVSATNARGGAILNNINPGSFSINNSIFTGNIGQYGAAIHNVAGSDDNRKASSIIIDRCTFEGNEATYGAAIFNDRHNTQISSSIFRGNYAAQHAGAIYSRNGNPGTGDYGFPRIINCLITGNRAVNYGGGIYNNGASPEIINSTLSGNYSERGGAVACVAECVVTGLNSIFWGNVASIEGNVVDFGSQTTGTFDYCSYRNNSGDIHFDSGGSFSATNSILSDPLFVSPVFPSSGNTPNTSGNYSLSTASPAIDSGNNAHLPGSIILDIALQPRLTDGDGNSIATVDMGAYESEGDDTLPIELATFTAVLTLQNSVRLDWVTHSESGISGYYILRNSQNLLSTAQVISPLIAPTNTSTTHAYTFTDTEILDGTWYYWLQHLDMNGQAVYHGPVVVVLHEDTNPGIPEIPLQTGMQSIYPNPFNPSATISFSLAAKENLSLDVFNARGQKVKNLISTELPNGTYSVIWNGKDDDGSAVASGIYLIRMSAGGKTYYRKAMLSK